MIPKVMLSWGTPHCDTDCWDELVVTAFVVVGTAVLVVLAGCVGTVVVFLDSGVEFLVVLACCVDFVVDSVVGAVVVDVVVVVVDDVVVGARVGLTEQYQLSK